MTLMISEVYEAIRSAGVPEEKARKAAERYMAHSAATNTLLRLVRQSEDAFWELVAQKQMSNELPVRKLALTIG